jgi:thiamine-monophosphate kinase
VCHERIRERRSAKSWGGISVKCGSNQHVRDIGEFELIARVAGQLTDSVHSNAGVNLGIGDDGALWAPTPGMSVVITTDALIEGVHFRLDWTDWTSLGHKMLAVNLSDIAAMGARPRVATIVLGLTGDEVVSDLESLYVGAGGLAAAHGVVIAGGDVVRVPHGVTLSVSLLGEVEPGRAMTRRGAQPGDLIVVSGTLGASAAGMALLEAGSDHTSTGPLLIGAHLRPNPRMALGRILFESGVTSAMDLSDGLLGDLPKILEASGVSGEVDVARLPILPAVRALFPDRYEDFGLRGGEDYELLLTIPADRLDELRANAGNLAATITPVGRILDRDAEPHLELLRNGRPYEGPTGAFDHFG